jgi:DNA-binding XRE family transcriptional regulator
MPSSEHVRAKDWREAIPLTRDELGRLIGYSAQSIQLFELGHTPPRNFVNAKRKDRKIEPKVWLRYKAACAGIDAWLKHKRRFDW